MKLKGVTWWTRIKPVKATTTQLSIDSGLPENKEDGQENKMDEQGKKEGVPENKAENSPTENGEKTYFN